MVELFVPLGYCSKTFWPTDRSSDNSGSNVDDKDATHQQPFSVYHLDQPHHIRVKYGHLGASPLCRANAAKSMQLLRRVLQPAINKDIVEIFQKYILVFREGAENACENMSREPFKNSSAKLDVDAMLSEICQDALENAKSLFGSKEAKSMKGSKDHNNKNANLSNKSTDQATFPASLPSHVLPGRRRAASPDLPWQRRLKDNQDLTLRRSLSPLPKKRIKTVGHVAAPRRYGSPHRNTKEIVRRKIENWDPSRINLETKFVMGTKANRALGLGATRGRIYMKHPDLFKYAGDHDDKKWMVKNNCMAATGGKNTFLMMADDVMNLFETEYKDSPGTMPEELQFFKLPEFVLHKMRTAMVNEKRLRVGKLSVNKPQELLLSSEDSPMSDNKFQKAVSTNRIVRQAAQVAAAAISATSTSPDDKIITTIARSPALLMATSDSDQMDSDMESDNGAVS